MRDMRPRRQVGPRRISPPRLARRGLASILVALGLSVTLPVVGATSRAASVTAKKRCKLKGKGKTVDVNSNMRVIRRRFREGSDDGFRLVACARGVGKNRTLGVSTLGRDFRFESAAGTFVAVTRSEEDQLGVGEATLVINVRSGRSFSVSDSTYQRGDVRARYTTVRKIRLDGTGRAVAAVVSGPAETFAGFPDRVEIRGFGATRASRLLDAGTPAQIDPGSVRLQAGIAYWMREGRRRQAAL